MEISTKAWKSRQKHGNLDKSMEISTKAWKSRQKHGDLDKSMEILTKAWKSRQQPEFAGWRFSEDLHGLRHILMMTRRACPLISGTNDAH
jgi:hypothetical protein